MFNHSCSLKRVFNVYHRGITVVALRFSASFVLDCLYFVMLCFVFFLQWFCFMLSHMLPYYKVLDQPHLPPFPISRIKSVILVIIVFSCITILLTCTLTTLIIFTSIADVRRRSIWSSFSNNPLQRRIGRARGGDVVGWGRGDRSRTGHRQRIALQIF